MGEEKFPVSESLKIIQGITIYKTDTWWEAVVLVDSFGRKQVATYLWNKKNDQWKRKQKFVIHRKEEWTQIAEAVQKLLTQLP